jgi:hypothetical protein
MTVILWATAGNFWKGWWGCKPYSMRIFPDMVGWWQMLTHAAPFQHPSTSQQLAQQVILPLKPCFRDNIGQITLPGWGKNLTFWESYQKRSGIVAPKSQLEQRTWQGYGWKIRCNSGHLSWSIPWMTHQGFGSHGAHVLRRIIPGGVVLATATACNTHVCNGKRLDCVPVLVDGH